MKLKRKKEIFVKDLDQYYKNKKYQDELIGLYEPDAFDLEIVIKNYANSKYQFIAYFEQRIPDMPKYDNIHILTDFVKFYNLSSVFAVYQVEEYYMFDLKLYDTMFYKH
ncbi:MAG: hypothetical protein ACPKM0_03810 [Pleomorphochaeta sp.]